MIEASVEVSVVGPAMNEAGNLEEFVERCIDGFEKSGVVGEVVIVDDGSTDGTGKILSELIEKHPHSVKGYWHRKNFGLTEALKTGFNAANGKYIIWISTDLESHPDEDIPLFMEGLREGADVVSGARVGRHDGKSIASFIYNIFCKCLFKLDLRDMNWMKGFKRECLPAIELRGDWHRFILVMLHMHGYKIIEKDMNWYPRKYGQTKFGLMRFPRSIMDALSIWFLFFFSRKPMRFFGALGLVAMSISVLTLLGLSIYYWVENTQIRPLFWSALVLMLFAVQMFFFGFLGELMERTRGEVQLLKRSISKLRDKEK